MVKEIVHKICKPENKYNNFHSHIVKNLHEIAEKTKNEKQVSLIFPLNAKKIIIGKGMFKNLTIFNKRWYRGQGKRPPVGSFKTTICNWVQTIKFNIVDFDHLLGVYKFDSEYANLFLVDNIDDSFYCIASSVNREVNLFIK